MSQGYAAPSHAAVEIEPDETDDLVAISGAQLDGKGKGRAQDSRLAPPTANVPRSASPAGRVGSVSNANGQNPNDLSGKIGTSRPQALRTQIGGIAVETRYSGINSLDESVGESLVGSQTILTFHHPRHADWDLFGTTAARLASYRQQAAASVTPKLWQRGPAGLGPLGTSPLYDYIGNPAVNGRFAETISIRLHWRVCHCQCRQCGHHAELQAIGRQGVRVVCLHSPEMTTESPPLQVILAKSLRVWILFISFGRSSHHINLCSHTLGADTSMYHMLCVERFR